MCNYRDVGAPIILSHLYLLLGCAIPVWVAAAGTITSVTYNLSYLSSLGVTTIAIGDAMVCLFNAIFMHFTLARYIIVCGCF